MVIDSHNGIKPGHNGGQRPAATQSEGTPQKGTTENGPPTASRDSVQLSAEGQSMNRLEDSVARLPDVDSERVAELKQAISDGRFEIDAERVAQNMLDQDDLLG